jgi:hypothetical protein
LGTTCRVHKGIIQRNPKNKYIIFVINYGHAPVVIYKNQKVPVSRNLKSVKALQFLVFPQQSAMLIVQEFLKSNVQSTITKIMIMQVPNQPEIIVLCNFEELRNKKKVK